MAIAESANGYSVQVLERAFRILELLADQPRRAAEVGARLGLHRSTVFRLLNNLEQWGYVRRDASTGAYSLGITLFQLGAKALQEEFPIHRLRPILADLAEATGQTTQLWIRSGLEALCLDQVEPARDVWVAGRVGRRLPLNCGAVAKVLLAFAPAAIREQVLAAPLPRVSPHSVIASPILRSELRQIRARGFAMSDGELRVSSKALAAPVINALGEVLTAVCILAPAGEIQDDNLHDITAAVKDAARRLSGTLGYSETTNAGSRYQVSGSRFQRG